MHGIIFPLEEIRIMKKFFVILLFILLYSISDLLIVFILHLQACLIYLKVSFCQWQDCRCCDLTSRGVAHWAYFPYQPQQSKENLMTNVPLMAQNFIRYESHVGNGVNTCCSLFYTFTHKNIVLQVWVELAPHSKCQHTHSEEVYKLRVHAGFMWLVCPGPVLI